MHFGYFRKTSSGGSKKPRVHKSQMLKPAVLEGAWTIDEIRFGKKKKKILCSDSSRGTTNFKVHF